MIPNGRPATPEDNSFQEALFIRVRLAEFLAGGLPESVAVALLGQQYRIRQTAYADRFPTLARWLLTVEDQAVGEMQWASDPEGLHLVDIALLPEYRGRGLGAAAIGALQAEAARSRRTLRLSVRRDNPARRLYARLGFTEEPAADNALDLPMIWSPR